MIDIAKQVAYWRVGAEEDWVVAKKLVADESIRHGLFFAHLALEKILKAHVCLTIQNLAPRTHNLTQLSVKAGLSLSQHHQTILEETNAFSLSGRYPEQFLPLPSLSQAEKQMRRCEEVFQWLLSDLKERLSKTQS